MVKMIRGWAAWCVVLMGTATCQAADWGDLSGTFVYDAAAPKPKRLDVNKDLECCGKYLDEIVDESVVVGKDGGLANVFVYLRLAPGKKVDVHPDLVKAAETPVVLDNVHCLFKPHALYVWGGKQKLIVTNNDPIGHAAKMDFLKNAPVNALVPAGGRAEVKLQTAESLPIPVTCGVHPWEVAVIKVHDSPYIGLTDDSGRFMIPKIPVGEWEFQVWHERSGFLPAKKEWSKGRFKLKVKAGKNDLGTIKVAASVLQKK